MILHDLSKLVFKNSSKPNITLLNTILHKQYSNDIKEADVMLDRSNRRTLEQKLLEQPSWLLYYLSQKHEIGSLVKLCESKLDAKKGELWIQYTEHYNLDLTQTDKNNYILNHAEYLNVYEIYLTVKEQYNIFSSIVDAFTAQGYSLTNLTKLKINDLEL